MTEDANRDLAAFADVDDVLEAYADARLAPSGPVLARMRLHVMAEAAAVAASPGVRDTDRSTRRWSLPTFRPPRRAFALGGAAVLTLASAAAVLAAPPGSPFFDARVALETAFLPSQSDARLAAHEDHLAQRLVEAEAAAGRGDAVALAAALAAYDAEVDAALADAGDDPDRLARLEAALGKHVAVLTALEGQLPEQAAVENALDNSQKAVEKIKAKGTHGGGKPSSAPGQAR
jgi:hypothetical protein